MGIENWELGIENWELRIMGNIIQDKSRAFAIEIINCYKYLVEEKHEYVLSKQLLRSGTSIGANTRESKNAQSKNDFLNKLSIALKEADETDYWLDLLHATNYIDDMKFETLANDCNEIIAILTSIIKTMRNQ